jgi:RNA polymerase sigma factor (sigma-70 family)
MPGEIETDASLLDAWRGGDRGAGEQLFERHVAGITRFFRNKVSSGIEDLVQDTFLALVEGRERVRDSTSIRSYLFAIAHNVLRAHLRGLGRERAIDDGTTSIADILPNMSSVVGQHREQQLLLMALRRLPLSDQIILELSFWEGLSATEIAEIIGTTGSAVRGRLLRGREKLAEELGRLATSPSLLQSTMDGFDRWVGDIRGKLSNASP